MGLAYGFADGLWRLVTYRTEDSMPLKLTDDLDVPSVTTVETGTETAASTLVVAEKESIWEKGMVASHTMSQTDNFAKAILDDADRIGMYLR
ncbi:uncharacterized protein FTJAE_3401 [Fusarium tjaetaba]|uniref:Uncharacterized protein n=1 Tax=Fusarium tjaetaba TaxID=1567544 RepID=A0A8H5S1J4_9HYPO|nr:uncharacterized protein FTJAE_3401 [Fusarium tjaetaba]KAF5642959.1 hypothetical protein FTJAE_3401 [Fusarium tjaetaba]